MTSFYTILWFSICLRFSKLQEYADARVTKDGQENVKLKLAGENRVVGIQLMLRNLGDEITSRETLMRLNSKNNSEKFNASLLMIPGIEGVSSIAWKNIASALNLPSFILQLLGHTHITTIPQLATSLFEDIKSGSIQEARVLLFGWLFVWSVYHAGAGASL